MTKTFNPAAIAKQFLRKELPEEFNFEHLDWLKQSAYGFSAALIDKDNVQTSLTKSRLDCFDEASDSIDEETVFNIASITKPITVTTILRMMESEEFARPKKFKESGNERTFKSLLEEVGYFEVLAQIQENEIFESVKKNPEYAKDWLEFSENKRVSCNGSNLI